VIQVKPQPQFDETDMLCDGLTFSLGQRFTVPRDVDALTVLDRTTSLSGGAIAYLLQNPKTAGADTTGLDALARKKPYHRPVYSAGSLFLISTPIAIRWATAASEEGSVDEPADIDGKKATVKADSRLLLTS